MKPVKDWKDILMEKLEENPLKFNMIKPTTAEILKVLIRNEFDNIDHSLDYILHKNGTKLINAALDLGFENMAAEMKNDLYN